MPFESFLDFTGQYRPLLQSEKYDEAWALIDTAEQQFPGEDYFLHLMRFENAAKRKNVATAAAIFERALNHGYSYANLEKLHTFGSIEDAPEIRNLLERNRVQYQDFVRCARGPVLIMEPEPAVTKPPLLLVCHGNGGRIEWEADFYRPATKLGWLVAMPQSVQPLFENRFIWGDDELATEQLQRFVDELREQNPFDESRVVLAGISKGAEMAVNLTLSGAVPSTGFVTIAAGNPYFPPKENRERLIPLIDSGRERGQRAFCIIGDQDFCYQVTLDLVEMFKERNLPCELEVHQGLGHNFPPNFEQSLERGIKFVVQST